MATRRPMMREIHQSGKGQLRCGHPDIDSLETVAAGSELSVTE